MSFDQLVIQYASPALCGIKPSNLFSVNDEVYVSHEQKIDSWNSAFRKDGLSFTKIKRNENSVLMFVCNASQVRSVCSNSACREYLVSKGYPLCCGMKDVMDELFRRLETQASFPHEIGIFLGYPLEDVISFEEKKRKEVFTGIWKVYSDAENARRTNEEYRRCVARCRNLLDSGVSVPAIARQVRREKSDHVENKTKDRSCV